MSRAGIFAALGVALAMPTPISAQLGLSSAPQSVRLSAVKQGWMSVSSPPGGGVATSWNLDPDRTASVTLVAQFAGPGGAIPAFDGPGRSTPPPGAAPVPATALVLFTQPIAVTNAIGTRMDGLEMRLYLPAPPGLPPGTYNGILNLVAITQ